MNKFFKVPSRFFLQFGLSFFFILFLSCINKDQNPYIDVTKTRIFTVPDHFIKEDTVSIFQTFSFSLDIQLPDNVVDITIHADHNRLWSSPETTIVLSQSLESTWPLSFSVSFTDTGKNVLWLKAHYIDGDSIFYSEIVYTKSPLDQPNIVANQGEPIYLTTPAVLDPGIYYVWEFTNDSRIIKTLENSSDFYPRNTDTLLTGIMYVEDGTFKSTPDSFKITLKDIIPPNILCLNDSVSADGKHIFSGNITSYAIFGITDPNGTISKATINDQAFEIDTNRSRYSKMYGRIDTLSAPLPLIVKATDASQNTSLDTFYLHYSSGVVADNPVIEMVDSSQTNIPQFVLLGTVDKNFKYDSLFMFLTINGNVIPGYKIVTKVSNKFDFSTTLSDSLTILKVTAYSSIQQVNTIAMDSIIVKYDPLVIDTKLPQISEVKVNPSVIEGTIYYTSDSLPTVTATLYDESGIKSATVNTIPMVKTTGTLLQYSAKVPVPHIKIGTSFLIVAEDNNNPGNKVSYPLTIIRNTQPRVDTVLPGATILTGQIYKQTLVFSDPDKDTITANAILTIQVLPSTKDTTIPIINGMFSWTPSVNNVGNVKVRIQYSDGYQAPSNYDYWISVQTPNQVIDTAHFIINVNSFPDTLQVGRDSLDMLLTVDKDISKGTYLFSAINIKNPNQQLIPNSLSNHLVWKPTVQDTGLQQLLVTVMTPLAGSSQRYVDSLKPYIFVKPAPILSFTKSSVSQAESMPRCTVGVKLSHPSGISFSTDILIDKSQTTADTVSDFQILSPRRLLFSPTDTFKQVILSITNDTLIENNEKVVLQLGVNSPSIIQSASNSTFALIIQNDDTLKGIDSVFTNFGTLLTTTKEVACTLSVPVSLSRKALTTMQVNVTSSGTATVNQDYALINTPLTFNPGDSIKNLNVRIINDTICEKTSENINLKISSVLGGYKGKDTLATVTIDTSDLINCVQKKTIAFIKGNNTTYLVDQKIQDSLAVWGYSVTTFTDNNISSLSSMQLDLILISQSVSASISGTLKSKTTPIIDANSDDFIAFGFARNNKDTISLNTQSIRIIGTNGFGAATNITQQVARFTRVSTAPATGGIIAASITTDTTKPMILAFPSGAILKDWSTAPAKRLAFCMAHLSSTTNEAVYTDTWWTLLKNSIIWGVTP